MKKTLIAVLLIVLTVSTLLLSGCNPSVNQLDLEINYNKAMHLSSYDDNKIEVFSSKKEIVEYFSDNELYLLPYDFQQKIDKLESDRFFDKKNIIFLTLNYLSSDTTVKATANRQRNKIEITFSVTFGILEDVGVRFFLYEIAKGEYEYKLVTSL